MSKVIGGAILLILVVALLVWVAARDHRVKTILQGADDVNQHAKEIEDLAQPDQ